MTAAILKFVRMDDLPNRIREYRKARDWTLEQLAERVDCSFVQVSDIERGKVQLTPKWMERFARALEVKPVDLLRAEDSPDSLSPDERALLDRFRRGTREQQDQLINMANILIPDAARAQERKRA